MKVYKNIRKPGWSGGMILVAANTKEEAIEVFRADPKYEYLHDYITWEFDTPPYWDEHYYPEDTWEEMPMLTANVDKPQVLAEEGYTE